MSFNGFRILGYFAMVENGNNALGQIWGFWEAVSGRSQFGNINVDLPVSVAVYTYILIGL